MTSVLALLVAAREAAGTRGEVHAAQGSQRAADPDGSRHADGGAVPAVLDPRLPRGGAAAGRLPADPVEAALRAPRRLPRQLRPLRPDRRVLRPPRRLAL